MTSQAIHTADYCDIIAKLPPGSTVILRNVPWEEYEKLLGTIDDPAALRISYNDGTLQIITVSSEHENYTRFIEKLVTVLSLGLRLKVLSFESSTMKRRHQVKGSEPDACF